MQFADYIVSVALQSLTRSLLRLRDPDAGLPDSEARLLAGQAEELLSLWQMMQWSVGKLQHDAARRDLREIVAICTREEAPEIRGARRLLQSAGADSEEAAGLADFIAGAPAVDSGGISHTLCDRLSCLLQDESARWREYQPLRQVAEEALIEHGMLRAFERAEKLVKRLDLIAAEGQSASQKRLLRAARWLRHCTHHLELLRPALSEAGRTRRWHLTRLAVKVEDQLELEAFARTLRRSGIKGKVAARLEKVLRRERRHLAKQRGKLVAGAFVGATQSYREEIAAAVEQLGLKEIVLLPLEARGGVVDTGGPQSF
ncbi:MAG: hypothetical protein R3E82_01140 [Pseudomonadales bacterium]|nr:hypothetical protein [Pseudomonadales bacterium]